LLRIKDSRKSSTYPRVCLWFSQTLMHQDLGTYLRNKSLNLGYKMVNVDKSFQCLSGKCYYDMTSSCFSSSSLRKRHKDITTKRYNSN
ncbi:MAG: hypothetical protein U9R02_10505, partial [Thermodesulfobacteriota bacterium]|nr:hypothetical protein [Thermodesulfobacteriota bacterium]